MIKRLEQIVGQPVILRLSWGPLFTTFIFVLIVRNH